MTTIFRLVLPVDTLSLRGNKLFGDAGDFAVQGVFPARLTARGMAEVFWPQPADLLVFDGGKTVRLLELQPLHPSLATSLPGELPFAAILRQDEATKPEGGFLLSSEGTAAYLAGRSMDPSYLVRTSSLWSREVRVGIGLSRSSRTVEEGKLFTAENTVVRQSECGGYSAGVAVALAGVGSKLPVRGVLRLGGDGRAASFEAMSPPDEFAPPLEVISATRCFKLVLLTPGMFRQGWLPDGCVRDGQFWRLVADSFAARLACVSLPRAEVASGWDMARRKPKDAERVVSAGAVYWFDDFQGDPNRLAEWASGSTPAAGADRQRWAEGYNRALLAAWGTRP